MRSHMVAVMRFPSGEQGQRTWRHFAPLIFVALLVCFQNVVIGRNPLREGVSGSTATYFEQLRKRQLFGVAEGYAIRRLAHPLSDDQRIQLTLELSRTFSLHARYAEGDEQIDLWDRSQKLVEDLIQRYPNHHQKWMVAYQKAVISAEKGEYFRWLFELAPHRRRTRGQALNALSHAIHDLLDLEKNVTGKLQNNRSSGARRLALNTLLANVRYRLCQTYVERASLYPRSTTERLDSLIDAESRLRKLAGGHEDAELTWRSKLLLAELNRLRGRLEEAKNQLLQWSRQNPSHRFQEQLAATLVRVQLDEQEADWSDANTTIADHHRKFNQLNAELQFLRMRVLLSGWLIAEQEKQAALATDLMRQLERSQQKIDQTIGGYWSARAALLMESIHETRKYGADLVPIVRRANALFHEKKTEEAVRTFAEAMQQAGKSNRPAVAAELGYTAGSITLQSGEFEQAVKVFAQVARQFPHEENGQAAHLMWAYCLGQIFNRTKSTADLQSYSNALTEHRSQYYGQNTWSEATWMLAQLQEARRQWADSLQLYRSLPESFSRRSAADLAIVRCYESLIQQQRDRQLPTVAVVRSATRTLPEILQRFPTPPRLLSETEAEISVRFARIVLASAKPNFADADRYLSRAINDGRQQIAREESETDEVRFWKDLIRSATQLRIVSLAGQDQFDEAARLLEAISAASVADVLSVLVGLNRMASGGETSVQRSLGLLQLKISDRIRRDTLPAEQRLQLDRIRANAFVATDQPLQAIALLEQLHRQQPKDTVLLQLLAKTLSKCQTAVCIQKRQLYWRKLESIQKPGSQEWHRAHLELIDAAVEANDLPQARKLLGISKLLYPDLGGSELKQQYLRWERQLQNGQH